eukprot:440649-Rhodomonas_salina.1
MEKSIPVSQRWNRQEEFSKMWKSQKKQEWLDTRPQFYMKMSADLHAKVQSLQTAVPPPKPAPALKTTPASAESKSSPATAMLWDVSYPLPISAEGKIEGRAAQYRDIFAIA